MPRLKAIKEIRYAGATYFPGEEFEASDKDAKVLVAIQKCEAAKAKPKRTPPLIVEKKEEPEPAPLSEPGHYLRRDMQPGRGLIGGAQWPSLSQADQAPEHVSTESDEKPKQRAGW